MHHAEQWRVKLTRGGGIVFLSVPGSQTANRSRENIVTTSRFFS